MRRNILIFLVVILILSSFANADSFVDRTTSFNDGEYNQTFLYDDVVNLNLSFNYGSYTSKIFDANVESDWLNLSWSISGYYNKTLPDNNFIETEQNGLNMSDNILLLHLNNTFNDFSGNNNSYCHTNCPSYSDKTFTGSSVYFDGVNDVINTFVNLSGKNKVTIGAFVYRESATNRLDIGESDNNNLDRIKLVINNNGYVYGVIQNGGTTSYGYFHYNGYGENISMYLVYDGTKSTNKERLKMYLNSEPQVLTFSGTIPSILPSFENNLTIGYDAGSGTYTTGYFGEVAIFEKPLGHKEIQDIQRRFLDNRMNLNVRSCNDVLCLGEDWINVSNDNDLVLNLDTNRYFQYKFDFFKYLNISHNLHNVSLFYNNLECRADYLSLCLTPESCLGVNGYWYDNQCNENEEVIGSSGGGGGGSSAPSVIANVSIENFVTFNIDWIFGDVIQSTTLNKRKFEIATDFNRVFLHLFGKPTDKLIENLYIKNTGRKPLSLYVGCRGAFCEDNVVVDERPLDLNYVNNEVGIVKVAFLIPEESKQGDEFEFQLEIFDLDNPSVVANIPVKIEVNYFLGWLSQKANLYRLLNDGLEINLSKEGNGASFKIPNYLLALFSMIITFIFISIMQKLALPKTFIQKCLFETFRWVTPIIVMVLVIFTI